MVPLKYLSNFWRTIAMLLINCEVSLKLTWSERKRYVPNCFEEAFVIKKVKNTVPWTYVISNLNVEETVGTF